MPLRVAHVTATFPPYPGGAGTVCFELTRGLAARGHAVEVFTARTAHAGLVPPTEAVVHRLAPLVAVGNAPLLPGLAALGGFDLVHLHYPFIFGAELLLLGAARRMPLVVGYHNRLVGDGWRRAAFAGYEAVWGRAAVRRARRVCTVADAHARTVPALRELRRSRPERLVEVPNGVDVEAFAPGDGSAVRERHGIGPQERVVAFVATLDRAHHLKRPDLALDVLARLRASDARLLVVGDGEWRPRLEGRAAALGVGDRVRFAGAVGHDALPGHLRAADVLLSTSALESFGIALIEAMACGVPVVTTDLPGPRSVVRDGVDGVLAPVGDASALAAAVDRVLALAPGERAAMGTAGRSACEARFAWPRIVDRLEAVYADVLG